LSGRVRGQVEAAHAGLSGLRGAKTLDAFVFNHADNERIYGQVEAVIVELRNRLNRILAAHDVHIGQSILEEGLYDLLRSGSDDPVNELLEAVEQHQLHEPGFVLYPLHSFGVAWDGLRMSSAAPSEVIFETNGIAVTPQLNDTDAVRGFLGRSAEQLGIDAAIPAMSFAGHARHPVLKWIRANPLMMIRVRSFSGGQYENQGAYAFKLALGAALVMMASVLTDRHHRTPRMLASSTSRVNNFQTLDIRHYLVFENAGVSGKLTIRRVPMNLAPQTLAQLSDLDVTLDPEAWQADSAHEQLRRLSRASATFERFHTRNVGGLRCANARTRVARKLFDSLFWFRRSFNSIGDRREAVVSQAVAFESLLTDSYGNTSVLHGKVAQCLAQCADAAAMGAAVEQLFVGRGETVHKGSLDTAVDMLLTRRAYVNCFMHLVERLHAAPEDSPAPIAAILLAQPLPEEPAGPEAS
jgi:hypothetical protein